MHLPYSMPVAFSMQLDAEIRGHGLGKHGVTRRVYQVIRRHGGTPSRLPLRFPRIWPGKVKAALLATAWKPQESRCCMPASAGSGVMGPGQPFGPGLQKCFVSRCGAFRASSTHLT